MAWTIRSITEGDLGTLARLGCTDHDPTNGWGWVAEAGEVQGVLTGRGDALHDLAWQAQPGLADPRPALLRRAQRARLFLDYPLTERAADVSLILEQHGFQPHDAALRWDRRVLTPEQIQSYAADGFMVISGLFESEEIRHVLHLVRADPALAHHAFGREDGEGGSVRLSLWNHPGDGVLGRLARSERVVNRVEELLGGEAYHYHSKLIQKDAGTGGAWAWHQDYGYWYENGVLFPDLCSVFVALDPATRSNGCLQLLRGSQRMGRIEHRLEGEQAGADPERVAVATRRLETVYAELDPGDAIFFHPNLLHRSDRNHSNRPRWAVICCYNAAANDPYKHSHHPRYTPLEPVADGALLEAAEAGGEDWLDPANDKSARKDV